MNAKSGTKKKRRRTVIIALVIVFFCVVILFNLLSQREKSLRVTVETVGREDLTAIISASGEVKPKKNVNISAHIPGRIVKIGVEEGQTVTQGDFLLKLDSTQYEANADRDQAVIRSFKADLIQAEARLKKDERYYDRQKKLYDEDLISGEQLEAALAQYEISKAQYEAIEYQIKQAEASLQSTLDNLQKTVYNAPIDGIISELPIEEGEIVAAGQMVAALMDVARVKLVVGVVERKVPLLSLNSPVEVFVESLGVLDGDEIRARQFSGTVYRISVAADEKTGLFTAEVAVDNEDGLLRPGMVGRAEVVVDEVNAFPVPVEAVVVREGSSNIFFADRSTGDVVRAVEMLLPKSRETDEFQLVIDLPENRRDLIYEGQHRLDDGEEIRILGQTTLENRWDYQGRLKAYGTKSSLYETKQRSAQEDGV